MNTTDPERTAQSAMPTSTASFGKHTPSSMSQTSSTSDRPVATTLKDSAVARTSASQIDQPSNPGSTSTRSMKWSSTGWMQEIISLKPELVICLGNTPLWAGTDSVGVRKMRGYPMWSERWECKVLCTYHPAGVMRQYTLLPVVVADLSKAAEERTFPEVRRPNHEIWIEPTLDDLYAFEREHLAEYAHLSIDIETQSGQITCIGFAPSTGVALVVPFVDWQQADGCYWRTLEEELEAWAWVKRITEAAPSRHRTELPLRHQISMARLRDTRSPASPMTRCYSIMPSSRKWRKVSTSLPRYIQKKRVGSLCVHIRRR